MADRRDALVGAARVVLAARAIPNEFEPDTVLSAVGRFVIEPNSPVVVPARVTIDVDLRACDEDKLERAHAISNAHWTKSTTRSESRSLLAPCGRRPRIRRPASNSRRGSSGRGGTVHLSHAYPRRARLDQSEHRGPTVMLFVPSAEGISHSEREYTADADLVNGLTMLTGVAHDLVSGELPGDSR